MKILTTQFYLAISVLFLSLKVLVVFGQYSSYSPQIIRTDGDGDDLGVLLTVLLLASRNKGSNCGCCNCCGANIPVPYPIPIPTNNPIIRTTYRGCDDDYDDDEGSTSNSYSAATGGEGGKGGNALSEPEQNIYILTNNDNSSENEVTALASGNTSKIDPAHSGSSRGKKKAKPESSKWKNSNS